MMRHCLTPDANQFIQAIDGVESRIDLVSGRPIYVGRAATTWTPRTAHGDAE